jgi:predicted transcriptional regulator
LQRTRRRLQSYQTRHSKKYRLPILTFFLLLAPDLIEPAVMLLSKFHTVAGTVVTTIQNTSISAMAFKEFLPKMQTLKNDILSLKSFYYASSEQQAQQLKLLLKVIFILTFFSFF